MNGLFFYIGLGVGLAAACGLRPYLPALLAGALGSAEALGVGFTAPLPLPAGRLVADRGRASCSWAPTCCSCASSQERFQAASQPAIVAQAVAVGALLFAGTLAAHGDAWWPGLIGGAAAAALALRASGPMVLGARARLPDRAAREALTIYLDARRAAVRGARLPPAPARLRALALLVVLSCAPGSAPARSTPACASSGGDASRVSRA